jgi:protein ImuB
LSRLACLHVPLFPLAARLRSEPELAGEALVLLAGNGTAARVLAASRRARRAGIRRGMSLPQARALLPRVVARGRDAICENAAQQHLLEIAEALSPRVESAEEGTVYLDLDGLERHWSDERALGVALVQAARRAGLGARAGIAGCKLAARVAADQESSPTIVAAGDEARFLAPLPLSRLLVETRILERLERWGIRSIGQFAGLPKNEIASRFGAAGQILHRQARGLDPHPLVPHKPPPTFDEGMDIEWPLTTLEPFLFVARAALERLCGRMTRCGLGCLRLETSLRLEPDGTHERGVELPTPTRDVKTLLTLVRLDLEAHPPGAPVIGFTLRGHPDRPRETQLSLFGPAVLSPDRLATTLARLFSLLGPERAGSPAAGEDHRPEDFHLERFAPPPVSEVREPEPRGHGLLAVRTLRPPVPLEVIVDGGPRRLATPVGEATAGRPRIEGTVRVASGPWSLEEDWWTARPIDRDYWDVELSDGGVYRIYRDRRDEAWFADGVYD